MSIHPQLLSDLTQSQKADRQTETYT